MLGLLHVRELDARRHLPDVSVPELEPLLCELIAVNEHLELVSAHFLHGCLFGAHLLLELSYLLRHAEAVLN